MAVKVAVIGAGVSGLAAACVAAKNGFDVTVLEKNHVPGGRARAFQEQGFMFDMGPSWYWMPDVFEKFFALFGNCAADFYRLVKLDPGFRIYFSNDHLDVPASTEEIYSLFENTEAGSADKLRKFLREAAFKYENGMMSLAYKPSLSWSELLTASTVLKASRYQLLRSFGAHVRSLFKDPRLIALLEFPVLFLGSTAARTPAMYSLMNHAALSQGTYYPLGGMTRITDALTSIASSLGVGFRFDTSVQSMEVDYRLVKSIDTSSGRMAVSAVIASADYHHVEQTMLHESYRNYSPEYWSRKVMAPSCLVFYLGVKRSLDQLVHHNLFFDADFTKHAGEIYSEPGWPEDPLFYVCCPSRTDASVAPIGMENLFVLVPLAPGLDDTEELREKCFGKVLSRLERRCGPISQDIVFKRSYCVNDFKKDYNAYRGNAYGLANTLRQTAVLRPSLRNRNVSNIFYAGQLTVPGPGVPPALISGQLSAELCVKYLNANSYARSV